MIWFKKCSAMLFACVVLGLVAGCGGGKEYEGEPTNKDGAELEALESSDAKPE